MTRTDGELMRALHDEHADALWAYVAAPDRGPVRRAGHGAGDAAARLAAPRGARPRARSGPGWLFTVARRLVIDDWRTRPQRAARAVTDAVPERPGADDHERVLESWVVADALRQLSPEHRDVLVECYYRGRSVAEAAGRSGSPRARSSPARTTRCCGCGSRCRRWG